MQAFGRVAGGGSLGSVPLCFTQVSDGLHERDKPRDQRDLGKGSVVADRRSGGQQSGCAAQAVSRWGGARDAPVGGTGGAVVRIGGLAQYPAAHRGRGGMQGVGSGPGRIGRGGGVGGGEVADLGGGVGAVRAACSQMALRSAGVNGSPGIVRAGSQRQRSLGRVRSGASFPPPMALPTPRLR